MIAAAPKPFSPIPSGDLAEHPQSVAIFVIRPVVLNLLDRSGNRREFRTDRSNVLFARIREAVTEQEYIAGLSEGGLDADADSIAALNSYLRTACVGRMGLPWHRANIGTHRYAWASFCEYVGLTFL